MQSIGRFMAALIILGMLFTNTGWADGHRHSKSWFEREERDRSTLFDTDDEGNETAGQMAAWMLVAANLTVALSVLIKWTGRWVPMGPGLKDSLVRFNRFQKKHLMRLHYIINPLVLIIALWHWLSSRCRSTALPEWGLAGMVALIVLGLVLKFGLCPKPLRKPFHRIHTQPLILIAMVMVLTIGHWMVD